MRGIDAAGMPPALSPFAPGPAPQLLWVRVQDLVVDETYQRPIRGAGRKNIAAIAEAFCWSKFAPLIVSPIAGGRYAVIDGQHRATAAALRGVDQLPAQVIIAGQVEQAAAFKAVNGQTTRMHALEIHRAGVASGDAEALEIDAVCRRAGAMISPHPRAQNRIKPGETNAVAAVRAGLRRHGAAVVELALKCVTGSTNNKAGVLSSVVVEGLCALVAAHPEWETEPARLVGAFDRIVILREVDKARFQERAPGVTPWEVLRDRLAARVAEQLAVRPAAMAA